MTLLFTLINFSIVIIGIAGFILFCIVLFKLNKALNIWLKQNSREGESRNRNE